MSSIPCVPARFLLSLLASVAVPCFAQAPVSDLSTSRPRVEVSESYEPATSYGATIEARPTHSAASGGENASFFNQFQQLQEEVALLRGQLEEQGHEIRKLKEQLQGASSLAPAPVSPDAGTPPPGASQQQVAAPAASRQAPVNTDGRDEYESAYASLKAKDNPAAKTAFRALVDRYPNSEYAGNSLFWLGFIYQMEGDIDASANAFSSMIERFPGHAKADDARYNLGKLYHQQGKNEQARTLLQQVAGGSSKSAPLAKSYLETM